MNAEERKKVLELVADGKVSVDDAERLLAALGGSDAPVPPAAPVPPPAPGAAPRTLRIQVDGPDEHVNVRVPMQLIRAGIGLSSLIPDEARGALETRLGAHGLRLDLGKLKGAEFEEVIKALGDTAIDVNDKNGNTKVRIYCE